MIKNMFIKRWTFYFRFVNDLSPYRDSKHIGSMYLWTNLTWKVVLREAFKSLFDDWLVQYNNFFKVMKYIAEHWKFWENTWVFKFIIHRPIIYLVETFRFWYDEDKKFFYFKWDKGNIIRFAWRPNFIIEAYKKMFWKEAFIKLIYTFQKTNDLLPEFDNEFWLFKVVYDFKKINNLLNINKDKWK